MIPQQGALELIEHDDRFFGNIDSHGLWRRDDHGAGKRDPLAESELHIPGAGREIDDQIIELAPLNLA